MTERTEQAGKVDKSDDGSVGLTSSLIEPLTPTLPFWSRASTFWISTVLVLVLMLALIPTMDNGNVAVPDDGVYAAQAESLADGGWSQLRPAADIDSDGFNSAINPSVAYSDRQVPYLRHPVFPLLLAGFYRVAGFAGLLALSVLGVWTAAVAAGLMARRIRPAFGLPTLALTGLGSPLLFDAYLVSAHGMAAGLCGLVALGVAQVVDGRRWLPLAFAIPSAACVVMIRSEGLIAVVALGLMTGLLAIRLRSRRIGVHGAIAAISTVLTAVASFVLDTYWSRAIKSGTGSSDTAVRLTAVHSRDPLAAAWVSLIRPWYDAQSAQPLIVFAVAGIVIAAVSIRVSAKRWLLPVALLVLAAASLAYVQFTLPSLVTGLFAAFPLIVAGVVLLRREDLLNPLVARNLGAAAMAAIAITLLTYDIGGATEWGGRFYHLLIPLMTPIVVVGLHRGYKALPVKPARIAAIAVVISVASLSVFSMRYLSGARSVSKRTVHATITFAEQRAHATGQHHKPLVIMTRREADGSGRIFWKQHPAIDVLAAAGLPDLFRLVATAEHSGRPSVTVITDVPPTTLSILGQKQFESIGWEINAAEPILGTPFGLVQLGPGTAGDP